MQKMLDEKFAAYRTANNLPDAAVDGVEERRFEIVMEA
jgi:hypothetical protein